MFGVRLLPWEYGVRNLFRRPGRSLLTLAALTLVVLLIFIVVGFVRGLEASLAVSGDPRVVLVHSAGASENVENSSIQPTASRSGCASSRQGRSWALRPRLMRPAPSRTLRCLQTAGMLISNGAASSLTDASPSISRIRMARRVGSAIAERVRLSWSGCTSIPN